MQSLASFRNRHEGETVLVCGCGESLNELEHPEGFLTIGVNDVGRRFQPDYLVVVNPRSQFKGDRFRYVETSQAKYIFTQLELGLGLSQIVKFHLGQYGGTDFSDPESLPYTRNSPYVAVCLAVQMGARRIGLLGVDFTDNHFFAKTGRHPLAGSLQQINEEYKKLGAAVASRGVKLVNLSHHSRLRGLRKVSLAEFADDSGPLRELSDRPTSLHVVSYSTTPVAGVPAILARCIAARTPHACRCVWATRSYGNGVAFKGDLEWGAHPLEAEAELEAADVVIAHNGKVDPRHKRILATKRVVTLAHNYMWNVGRRFERLGMPRLVVGQYQATLPEFAGWTLVPNPMPIWEAPYSPGDKSDVVTICYTPSGRHERYPPGHRLYWHGKGYETTMRVLDRLAATLRVRLEVVRDGQVAHAEALAMKRRAHIVLDECVTGSYHRNSLEGLATGCVVVNGVGLLPAVVQVLQRCAPGSGRPPFVFATLDTLEAVLRELIVQGPQALAAVGRANRAWMERHWNFAEQWQCFWQPAIETKSDARRPCNQKPRKRELSTMQKDKVSVIVPHGGRERLPLLAATLASLRRAAAVGEVIVVEMGVSPVAADVATCWDCRHLFIQHDGAFERARALNAGTAIASHETIVWHDNDLLHAPAFLGRAVAELRARSLDFLLPYSAVHYLSESDSLAVMRGERAPANAVPASSLGKSPWIGCVGIVRREFVRRHGGLIEGFRGWGGEDNAWFHKAARCGQVGATAYTDQPVYHLYHPLCGGMEPGKPGAANPHYANNVERLRQVRATRCAAELAKRFPPVPATPPPSTKPLRNVFACLVHESPECILDLVRNLRFLDPESVVIVYNGSPDQNLIARAALPRDDKVIVHPKARPLSWGSLHPFALDCMAFALERVPFDTLTIVDSDQLALRAEYSQFLALSLAKEENVGLLGNSPQPQPRSTRIPPAAKAWQEVELWRPFLRNFRDGEAKFVHWSFWPSTVITGAAARELVALFGTNRQLQELLGRSRLWATEEILFPTLTALLGFRVIANPCRDRFVQHRKQHSEADLQYALDQPTIFWMHPVPRQYGHVFRRKLRDHFAHYSPTSRVSSESTTMITKQNLASTPLLTTLPVIECKNRIEGWLEDDEADLLLAAARLALESTTSLALVEIGSYCGRSTVVLASAVRALRPHARVFAIDPFDGDVGAADVVVQHNGSTLERFQKNIASAGVAEFVKSIAQHSYEVEWNETIGLLFVDGLHDYANVARDFRQFERWLCGQGLAVFHDFADYYPGVQAFVRELLATGEFEQLSLVRTLAVLRKNTAKRGLPI